MNCERFDQLVDDYVDGELDEQTRLAADRHLASCPDCRGSVEQLRGLLEQAVALPREIEPPLELLPAIRRERGERARSGRPKEAARRPALSASWLGWAGLAASLLLLVTAIGVGSGWWQRSADPAAPVAVETPPPTAVLAEFRAAEGEYLRATRLLLDSLEANGGKLSPETTSVIEENLAIIDRAIADVRLALADDPNNHRNGQVLTALHRQKLQLLMRASRLSS